METKEQLTQGQIELLSLIHGEGKFSIFGGGLHTYPDAEDEDNQNIYSACVDLENMGLIRRKIDQKDHVLFVPRSDS